MMGSGFGADFWRGLCTIGVLLFLGGLLIGAGCHRGCSYVARHLNVELKP
jgi:hypothetical protein